MVLSCTQQGLSKKRLFNRVCHRTLLHEAQSGQNVHLYKEALELIGDKLGPPEKIKDQAWIDRVQEQNDKALEKLEVRFV